ncbi:MAG TPA: cobalamin biosynthesis protein CobU [Clostridiaceae bacterium]|nr:cobalamin biosynthesis protein CobU [Clostridiaceae bacterium]
MVLVFGGAYQGKLEYVIQNYKIREIEIFYCDNCKEIDFSRKVIYGLEKLILNILKDLKDEADPIEYISKNLDKMMDKIIICTDISCGIVPTDPLLRQWREAVGRCMALLSQRAERVIRVFCGIGTVLK